MNIVQQGATFTFETGLSGSDKQDFTVTMDVLQYPGNTPAISRVLILDSDSDGFLGVLTAAETAALAVGQWFIHLTADDPDEEVRKPIKLYVSKSWVA